MSNLSPVLLIILLMVVISINPAAAHPPAALGLTYNSDSGLLNVTILHQVADLQDHYIRTVTISTPEKTLRTKEYTSQPDLNEFTYSYSVAVPKGTVLKVTAVCSKVGSLSQTLDTGGSSSSVPPGSGPASKTSTSSPGFSGVAAFAAFLCVMGIWKRTH